MFIKINGDTHYLWRAVDHEGEVLEAYVTKSRNKRVALKFLRKAMKRYGSPEFIVTDRLRSYNAAMKDIGNAQHQVTKRWANNRAENSHLPFRRREQAMLKFRRMRSLAEVRYRSFLNLQPVQPGAPFLLTREFQTKPQRCPLRVAATLHRLKY